MRLINLNIKMMLKKFCLRMVANTQEASLTISETVTELAFGQLLPIKVSGKTMSTTELE